MILLLADSLFLLFITLNLGLLAQKGLSKLFRIPLATDPLGLFLLGLALSTVYFNTLSFWFPVNYWSLLPLFALACWTSASQKPAYSRFRQNLDELRSHIRANPILATLTGILLLLFWFNPSTVPDSSGYHILAIRWYESFPAVPGLGNLHGRLAFNPSSFIIAAAYSFTGLTGQSIYPLNGLLSLIFLSWILIRTLRNIRNPAGWVYSWLLALFYRALLSYMSSPNSDVLPVVCATYPLLAFFERLLTGKKITLSQTLVPLILCMYGPTAKLSAFPLAVPCLVMIVLLPPRERRIPTLLSILGVATLLYGPWIGRNYILSGYILYPLPFPDLFHPDWKIPPEMLQIDYLGAKYSCRSTTNSYDDFLWLEKAPFASWFVRLLHLKVANKEYIELILLAAAFCSPLGWLFSRRQRPLAATGLFWLSVYSGFWLWVLLSMDYRLGFVFVLLPFALPLLPANSHSLHGRIGKFTGAGLSLFLCLLTVYYLRDDLRVRQAYYKHRGQPFSWQEGWVKPLQDAGYFVHNGKDDFPYRLLSTGWKLYQSDSTHDCLNAGLPCQIVDYGWLNAKVEMRGKSLSAGFSVTSASPTAP